MPLGAEQRAFIALGPAIAPLVPANYRPPGGAGAGAGVQAGGDCDVCDNDPHGIWWLFAVLELKCAETADQYGYYQFDAHLPSFWHSTTQATTRRKDCVRVHARRARNETLLLA